MGFVFIPLSTVAFLTLPPRYRTDGTAMLTLVRNVASSAGISVVIANLTNMTTTFHSQLAEHISPFNDALQSPDVTRWMDLATDQGRALADQMITLQAVIMAYANDFMLLTAICVAVDPVRVRDRLDRLAARQEGGGRGGGVSLPLILRSRAKRRRLEGRPTTRRARPPSRRVAARDAPQDEGSAPTSAAAMFLG